MLTIRATCIVLIAAALAGCAAAAPGFEPVSRQNAKRLAAEAKADPAAAGRLDESGYVLSADEQRWDCKKLSGAVQVGIMRYRSTTQSPEPGVAVAAGRTIGSLLTKTPKDDGANARARERARLFAFNRALDEKRCRTFDLQADLNAPPTAPVPTPRAPPPKQK